MPDPDTPTGAPETCLVPSKRPHVFRRLYYWVLHWAYTPYAVPALAALAFAESSFFPVPPDVLLMAMALGNRRKAFRYAAICTVFSVLGGIFGFLIGYYLMEYVGNRIIDVYNARDAFNKTVEMMRPGMNLWVFVAAFSPIPYKVFTIAAGVVATGITDSVWPFFGQFVLASALGRGGRFFLVSALLYFFGDWAKRFIDKYFEWLALAFGLLAVAGVLVVKYWDAIKAFLSQAAGPGSG